VTDAETFDATVRALHSRLAAAAYMIVRDKAAAEDIVQDALLATWRRRDSLGVPEGLAAYLFQACRNRALNHLRNQRRRDRTMAADPEATMNVAAPASSADQTIMATDLRRALDDAIATLAPGARDVFLLSRERGLSYSEIATLRDISVKTVETQMSRALRALRQRLQAWQP
jgi:RNA polymerase sigma-70 factor (ECF subfamily)